MRKGRFVLLSLCAVSMLAVAHCASSGSPQAISKDGEYRKLLELQKQKAEAAQKETELKNLPEMSAEDHDRLGDRYLSQGNVVIAFVEFQKALELKPTLVRTRYKLGRLYLSRGLTEDALRCFEIIEKQEPRNALAFLGKGLVYFRKGEKRSAEEQLNFAVKLDGSLWQAHAFLGLLYDDQKQFEKALTHYRQGLLINPKSAVLYNNLGMSCYLKGDYVSSANAYVKALEIDPSIRKTYNNLGLSLSRLGRHEEALEAFKRGNDEAGAYNNMGYVYITEQNYREAANALKKAIELNPQFYARARENLESVTTEAR